MQDPIKSRLCLLFMGVQYKTVLRKNALKFQRDTILTAKKQMGLLKNRINNQSYASRPLQWGGGRKTVNSHSSFELLWLPLYYFVT